jgi:hypothetical protein
MKKPNDSSDLVTTRCLARKVQIQPTKKLPGFKPEASRAIQKTQGKDGGNPMKKQEPKNSVTR